MNLYSVGVMASTSSRVFLAVLLSAAVRNERAVQRLGFDSL
jgi:hypothetical protein